MFEIRKEKVGFIVFRADGMSLALSHVLPISYDKTGTKFTDLTSGISYDIDKDSLKLLCKSFKLDPDAAKIEFKSLKDIQRETSKVFPQEVATIIKKPANKKYQGLADYYERLCALDKVQYINEVMNSDEWYDRKIPKKAILNNFVTLIVRSITKSMNPNIYETQLINGEYIPGVREEFFQGSFCAIPMLIDDKSNTVINLLTKEVYEDVNLHDVLRPKVSKIDEKRIVKENGLYEDSIQFQAINSGNSIFMARRPDIDVLGKEAVDSLCGRKNYATIRDLVNVSLDLQKRIEMNERRAFDRWREMNAKDIADDEAKLKATTVETTMTTPSDEEKPKPKRKLIKRDVDFHIN